MALIELDNVSFTYPGSGSFGVEEISFSLHHREVLALVGKSGIGKSTLLKLIATQLKPLTGKISRAASTQKAGALAYVSQEATLFPWMKVADILQLSLSKSTDDSTVPRHTVKEVLRAFGLQDAGDLYPKQLSGGMRQRVALAFAMLRNPELLLLDEPFSAVDDFTRKSLHLLLQTLLIETKAAAVLVSHNLDECLILADRIVVLAGTPGRIVAIRNVPSTRPRGHEVLFDQAVLELKREILCEIDFRNSGE